MPLAREAGRRGTVELRKGMKLLRKKREEEREDLRGSRGDRGQELVRGHGKDERGERGYA